jgi:hypothetical protein
LARPVPRLTCKLAGTRFAPYGGYCADSKHPDGHIDRSITMTTTIHRPEDKHPQPYQQDLNPDASKGLNWGLAGVHPEKNARTAHEVKEVHELLSDFPDDQLKQIPILPAGTRLETNATYISLKDPQRRQFTAEGTEEVQEKDWVVPKKEVDYQLWNKLIGVSEPARTGGV